MTTLREQIRAAELEQVRRYFPAGARVLEIGGAAGHQARIMSGWGLDVTSIDVAPRVDPVYPVQAYDGLHIPLAERSVDVVFSSNVLEHVEDIPGLLREATRVLKPDGVMVHIVPSSAWRWWTSVAHYAWVLLSVIGRRPNPEAPGTTPRRPYTPVNLLRFMGRIGFPHAHGLYANALVEQYCYSRRHWKNVLERCGLVVVDVKSAGVFYTAFKIFASLGLRQRQRLARILGSSCNAYVLRVNSAE